MANDYKSRMDADIQQAKKILRGEAPVQETKGVMTNAERRAAIASAFGAKAEPKEDELVFKYGNNNQKD